LREVLLVGGGGAATALATTIFLQGATWYKREQFALFFTMLLIPLIVRLLLKQEPKDLKGGAIVSPWKLVVVGVFSGIVSAMSGLGGGVVMVPLLADRLNFPIKTASSISLGAIVLMATSSLLFYSTSLPAWQVSEWQIGWLALPAVLPMALGVVLAAPFGVRLSHSISPRTMKLIFLLFFIVVILQMNFSIFG